MRKIRDKAFTLLELLACQPKPWRRQVQAAFTLLELLVVIAIIGLLAGILLPALNLARQHAWRTRAKEDVHQIVTAWRAYLFDYRKFPDINIIDINEMDTNAVAILGGSNNIYHANIQNIIYMEFTTRELTNGFRDHWESLYQVALDNGGTNDTTGAYDGWVTPANTNVAKSVAAWSKGRKNGLDGYPDDPSDDVISWY